MKTETMKALTDVEIAQLSAINLCTMIQRGDEPHIIFRQADTTMQLQRKAAGPLLHLAEVLGEQP